MKNLKIILFGCFMVLSIFSNAQTKDKILLELKNKLVEQVIKPDNYEVKLYYNIEEKILDIDEEGDNKNGIIIPLNKVSFKYSPAGDNHYLDIKCKINEGCMYSKTSDNINQLGRRFPSKKTVYEIIDLIYKLKKIE
tara:strand:+ start:894 stop:1304 length:411 start_codon:yes stop_codon:yes gene_type:complete